MFEVKQSFSDEPIQTCPECGGEVRKVINSVGVVFKGSGFYVTDTRDSKKSNTNGSSKSDKKADTSTESKSESKESTTTKSDSSKKTETKAKSSSDS